MRCSNDSNQFRNYAVNNTQEGVDTNFVIDWANSAKGESLSLPYPLGSGYWLLIQNQKTKECIPTVAIADVFGWEYEVPDALIPEFTIAECLSCLDFGKSSVEYI